MSFIAPLAFALLIPLGAIFWASRAPRFNAAALLPGTWGAVVAPRFRAIVSGQSRLSAAKAPFLTLGLAALVALSLTRPGLDLQDPEAFSGVGGRVVVMDIGADLSRHRQFLDQLHGADRMTSTAVVAVSGDAYRVTPFTTDRAHIDRYVRVLSADMMPRPGQQPHLGLAHAERLLDEAGYLVRQVVFLSKRPAPPEIVTVPIANADRIVVDLGDGTSWRDWAEAQQAEMMGRDQVSALASDFTAATRAAARAELPDARFDLTPMLIALAALLFLLKFRRRED